MQSSGSNNPLLSDMQKQKGYVVFILRLKSQAKKKTRYAYSSSWYKKLSAIVAEKKGIAKKAYGLLNGEESLRNFFSGNTLFSK